MYVGGITCINILERIIINIVKVNNKMMVPKHVHSDMCVLDEFKYIVCVCVCV